jgi:hypothetical protein
VSYVSQISWINSSSAFSSCMQICVDLALNQIVPSYEIIVCSQSHVRLINTVTINSTFITMNGVTLVLYGATYNETDTINTWPYYSLGGISNVTANLCVNCILRTLGLYDNNT